MSTGTATKTGRIGYYETKGHAVNAFDMALAAYDLCFAAEDCDDFAGDDGWKTLAVCNGGNIRVGYARLSWHRMESGRYEFTGYIS
jgi:hypothetical protein